MSADVRAVLSKVRELLKNGLHNAAINLLQKYIETDSSSSAIYRILGRLYLNIHQPDKAVIYLKNALEIIHNEKLESSQTSKYQHDNLGVDDFNFIESSSEAFSETDYCIQDEEFTQSAVNRRDQESSNNELNTDSDFLDSDRGMVLSDLDCKDNDNIIPEERSSSSVGIDRISFNNSIQKTQIDQRSDGDENLVDDLSEDEFPDQYENDLAILDYDELCDDYNKFEVEEESYKLTEVDFEDVDELEEFDENAHREIENVDQNDKTITREFRARQIAVEVINKTGWDIKFIPIIQQIFIESGWSSCRTAIERVIIAGAYPEEIALARKIRRFWAGNEQFWISFHKVTNNQQSVAYYKNISWWDSIRIIRCFLSIPDIEEIYIFMDEVFEYWYDNNQLKRAFPAFQHFIKHRVDAMSRALPDETVYSFLYYKSMNQDEKVDCFTNSTSLETTKLFELGIQLNQWEQPAECKINIIEELFE